MEVNLDKLEEYILRVIEESTNGNSSRRQWGSVENMVRKEERELTAEVSDDLREYIEARYAELGGTGDVGEIAKAVTGELTRSIREMFANAGLVNGRGLYSTFGRYADELERVDDVSGYVEKAAARGLVYKDSAGRARSLESGVKSAVLRAESEAAIRLTDLAIQETGADGVYISWHEGHRESHDFGGQTFTLAEYRERVLPKLREPNCYHRPYPVMLSETNQPWWSGNRADPFGFAEFLRQFNERLEQLKKLDEEIAKVKERVKHLREIGFTKEADKELETLRELEKQRDELTKKAAVPQPEFKSADGLITPTFTMPDTDTLLDMLKDTMNPWYILQPLLYKTKNLLDPLSIISTTLDKANDAFKNFLLSAAPLNPGFYGLLKDEGYKLIAENMKHNQTIAIPQTYIEDQNDPVVAPIMMGCKSADDNGCGWIAPYNALISLGEYSPPWEVVNYLETRDALIAYGFLGVRPSIYDVYFKERGYKSTTTFTAKNLDGMAKSGKTAILGYFNAGGITHGAHYINLTWNEEAKQYIAHNSRIDHFTSIADHLKEKGYTFISLTVIN